MHETPLVRVPVRVTRITEHANSFPAPNGFPTRSVTFELTILFEIVDEVRVAYPVEYEKLIHAFNYGGSLWLSDEYNQPVVQPPVQPQNLAELRKLLADIDASEGKP